MKILQAPSDEDTIRRCDDTCHEAREEDCECICGGRYHGLGSTEALAKFREDWHNRGPFTDLTFIEGETPFTQSVVESITPTPPKKMIVISKGTITVEDF